MTVSTTSVKSAHVGNGVTVDFATGFQFFDDAEVLVYVDGELQPSGYTVAGGAGDTGTVTFTTAPVADAAVVLKRRTTRTQAVDIANNTSVLEAVLEQPADRNLMLVQEALDTADRAVTVPDGEDGFDLPAAEDRAGAIFAFDEDGDPDLSRTLADFDADVASAAANAAAAAGSASDAQAAQAAAETAASVAISVGVNVRAYGAVGDGVTNDLAAFQAAVDSGAQAVSVPDGDYLLAGTLVLPAGVELVGTSRTGAVLIGARITVDGSFGSEVGLSSAAAAGDTTISFTTTGLAAGDYLRLVSCINASTSDAGVDQLGAINLACYFGEFVRAKTVAVGSITLVNGVTFPYSTTPGASSGTRTNSTARKVSFAEGGAVRGLTFSGPWSTTAPVIQATVAKDFWVEDCRFNLAAYGVRALDALDCLGGGMRKSFVVRDPFSSAVMTSTSWNSVIFRGCTETAVDDCEFDGGNQLVDFTFRITGATEPAAVPSIGCVARNNRAKNAFEGFTTHENAYACKFLGNVVTGCERGIRNRSKRTIISGNALTGPGVSAGIGIYNYGGFTDGTLIANNTVEGRQYGIDLDTNNSDGTPIQPGRTLVIGNDVSKCATGIFFAGGTASAIQRPSIVKGNIVRECTGNGIEVGSYNCGAVVEGNIILGPFGGSATAGIRYGANSTDVKIKNNVLVGLGAVFGIRGNSTASIITDTTTFPLGNAEARLVIEGNEFIGHTAGNETTGIVRDATAYVSELGGSTAFRRLVGQQVVRQLGSVAGSLIAAQTSAGVDVFTVDEKGNVVTNGGNWNTGHLSLGGNHIWVEAGILRIKTSTPSSATDGSAVGAVAADNSITNAKLADVATQTFKGRTTAGTGDPEDLTVAQAKALLGLTWAESGELAATAGTIVDFSHGLGALPKEFHAVLRCKTAEGGYAVGDEIHMGWFTATGTVEAGTQVYADATKVYCRLAQDGLTLLNASGVYYGAGSGLTSTNWRIVLRARA